MARRARAAIPIRWLLMSSMVELLGWLDIGRMVVEVAPELLAAFGSTPESLYEQLEPDEVALNRFGIPKRALF